MFILLFYLGTRFQLILREALQENEQNFEICDAKDRVWKYATFVCYLTQDFIAHHDH